MEVGRLLVNLLTWLRSVTSVMAQIGHLDASNNPVGVGCGGPLGLRGCRPVWLRGEVLVRIWWSGSFRPSLPPQAGAPLPSIQTRRRML